MKFVVKLENNIVKGAMFGAEPVDMTGWEEIETEQFLKVGMERLPDGSFSDLENRWDEVRAVRNRLMSETDWTQLPDTLSRGRLTAEQVDAFAEYRQLLADLPQNFDTPEEVVYPTKPE